MNSSKFYNNSNEDKKEIIDYIPELESQIEILYNKYLINKNLKTLHYILYLKKLLEQSKQQQNVYDIVNKNKINSEEYKEYELNKNCDRLKLHLDNCGSLAKRKWFCKSCEEEQQPEPLLRVDKIYQYCGIRYCKKIKCVLQRFALQIESLKNIDRLQGLKKLDHFVIGFEPITKEQFENNFDTIKKQHQRVMNSFFEKLRNNGFKIQAFKVLDISITEEENKFYIHYHIVAIPIRSDKKRLLMLSAQQTRKDMLKRQRIKIPFHIQFFGLKDKNALLSYLTLRSIGLYKFHDKKERGYNLKNIRKLEILIKQNKFMFLQDIISLETYQKHFYNHRHFSTIGGLPYGSIIMDNVVSKFPNFCKKHGELTRDRVRMEIELILEEKPPPNLSMIPKIEVVYLGTARQEHKENEKTP